MKKKERDPELEAIGQRIRAARLSKGMTKEALAEAAETSTQFLSQVEKGEQSMTMAKFGKLAKALRVSSDYLLFGRERLEDRTALAVEFLMEMNPIERDLLAQNLIHFQGLMEAIRLENEG